MTMPETSQAIPKAGHLPMTPKTVRRAHRGRIYRAPTPMTETAKRVKSFNAVTQQTTIFVYDAEGKLAAEYTINVPPPAVPTISYLTEDALGSPRVITNSFAEVKARRDFFPFGDEIWAGYGSRTTNQKYSSSTDDTRKKFATYQRDWETGLDFAQSRYYSPKHGRFTSPDEFKGGPDELFDFEEDASDNPTFYADLTNPQSLNKYQYTYNNPYKFNDPDGHCPICVVAVVIAVAVLTGPDYAVAPTGGETPAENKSYRTTYGGNALLNLGGLKGAGVAGNVLKKAAVTQTRKEVAKRVAKQGPNPFKGKTPKQIEKMFKKKGFTRRGPDPGGKKGGYVNEKTKRSYHIDPGGKYKKGTEKPHVDINRKKPSKKT
jgi:RHS repeat-associated protein